MLLYIAECETLSVCKMDKNFAGQSKMINIIIPKKTITKLKLCKIVFLQSITMNANEIKLNWMNGKIKYSIYLKTVK